MKGCGFNQAINSSAMARSLVTRGCVRVQCVQTKWLMPWTAASFAAGVYEF